MKVVKLDNRHRLFREGMTYAFKFTDHRPERSQVSKILSNMYGWEYCNNRWRTFYGKKGLYNRTRTYWVGVRNKADVSIVMLKLN